MMEMEDVQQSVLPQLQHMVQEINARMHAAEAQAQSVTQVLNSTQSELSNMKAQVAASLSVSAFSGLPKGVKTQAPDRFGGRPTTSYPTTQHFIDLQHGICVSVECRHLPRWTTFVTLHLSKGEARTWYDLRVKNVPTESFDSFSDALKTRFTNHNSQQHYREALQHLHMRQFKDVVLYNQAFRQMMLCLEDMSDLDKLTHCERGLRRAEVSYCVASGQVC